MAATTAIHTELDRGPEPTIRARGVELLGEMAGSGYRDAPLLVRRGDGQTIQLTPLLYRVLEAIDGHRSDLEIAWEVAASTGKLLAAGEVAFLIAEKLRPLGLVGHVDENAEPMISANPLLALRFRFVVSNPRVTRRLTAPFAQLFRPPVVAVALAVFAVVTGWVFWVKGLGAPLHDAMYEPEMLLLVLALTALSAGFHEFGHAAACRYGGATPGAMGSALYLVWPAFYTDVTDSYRLDRRGRLRVDLGGLYFNAIFAVGTFAAWWATRADALLLMVPIQVLQMLRQLVPVVRFDGYHILADLTGVPDLFARIKPTLLGLWPTHWNDPETKALKPWARAIVTLWVLTVVPLLAASLVVMVLLLPRVAATAWDSLAVQWRVLAVNLDTGDVLNVVVRVVSLLAIALPPLAMAYLVLRVARRAATKVWDAADDRPLAQGLLLVNLALAIAVVIVAWWPEGQYVPVGADERAAAGDAFGIRNALIAAEDAGTGDDAADAGARLRRVLRRVRASHAVDGLLPGDTVLAVAPNTMAPVIDGDLRNTQAGQTQLVGAPARADWPFPFGPPPAPGAGDNFAVAVNTVDGNTVTEMSSSLLWVDGGAIDNRNRTYALASCTDCTTAATAFQAVISTAPSATVVPENSAVAVNYECDTCTTHSVAIQLVVTLQRPATAEMRDRIGELFAQVRALEARADAATVAPLDLRSQLLAIKTEMLEVLRPAADRIVAETDSEGDLTTGDQRTVEDVNGDETSTSTSAAPATADGSATSTSAPADDQSAPSTTAPPESTTTSEPSPTSTTEPPSSTTTSPPNDESQPTPTSSP